MVHVQEGERTGLTVGDEGKVCRSASETEHAPPVFLCSESKTREPRPSPLHQDTEKAFSGKYG